MEGSEMEKPIVWQSIDIDLFAVLVLWVRPGLVSTHPVLQSADCLPHIQNDSIADKSV